MRPLHTPRAGEERQSCEIHAVSCWRDVETGSTAVHINPDHFLQTETGRVITPELNRLAWEKSYAALEEALLRATTSTKVFVLVGAQGAGKSTWAKARGTATSDAILFDAILVKRAERERILGAAKARSVGVVAVWFRTPLEVCLARNASRPADEVVPEQAVRNVFAAVEPPSTVEGFEQVLEVFCNETHA